MARGDRREDIVWGDDDREAFVALLGELVERTGWEVFSWVLMGNHYHLVFETPEPNLVSGMKWLQNTWTKRFNARHRLWGHVFGGRYKSVLVEENDHLACLVDYVHLNPVRAGLILRDMELQDYPWSSLGDYLRPPRKRSGWVQVERGLLEGIRKGVFPEEDVNTQCPTRNIQPKIELRASKKKVQGAVFDAIARKSPTWKLEIPCWLLDIRSPVADDPFRIASCYSAATAATPRRSADATSGISS
jgi:REP element-mobilizing transposase RayT